MWDYSERAFLGKGCCGSEDFPPKTDSKIKHLEAWQRYKIAARLEAGYTKKQVAEFLHVHPSTITHEIQRNGYSCYRFYRPKIAQGRVEQAGAAVNS